MNYNAKRLTGSCGDRLGAKEMSVQDIEEPKNTAPWELRQQELSSPEIRQVIERFVPPEPELSSFLEPQCPVCGALSYSLRRSEERRHERQHTTEALLRSSRYPRLLPNYDDRERVKLSFPKPDATLRDWFVFALIIIFAHFSRSVVRWHVGWAGGFSKQHRPHPQFSDFLIGYLAQNERDDRIPAEVWAAMRAAVPLRRLPGLDDCYWESPRRRR